jgi:STE24 endopeptidase
MRRFFIGLAAGFTLGYSAYRACQAGGDVAQPAGTLAADERRYGMLRRRLMLAGLARSFASLGAVAYGLAPAFEREEREPRLRRLALLAGALALSAVAELPVDYVEGHVLERRYGLSKQTRGAWALDQAKSFGVSLAVSLVLLELLASAIERAPRSWPALATAGTFPLLLLANIVAPNYIAPLFNTFEPLEGPLETRLRTLAARYGAGDAKILRVDMSRQTEKANAYVTGVFGSHRIVVGDTLIEHFPDDAIEFVVAHELGHYVSGDVWRAVWLGTFAAGAILFAARALAQRNGRSLASAAGLARVLFAATACGTLAGPVLAAFSRGRERAADRFAVSATNDPGAGVVAFTRLRERNLAEAEQPRWMELLFASHPPLARRIEALNELAVHGGDERIP